jgi:hypothetical protein
MMIEFDVTCDQSLLDDGSAGVAVKLSSEFAEVNVWFTVPEAQRVGLILELAADESGMALGRSAASSVFWARDEDDQFSLLIGEGDTTWDIGFSLSPPTLRRIVQSVTAELDREAS